MKISNYKNIIQNNISEIINDLKKTKEIKSEIKKVKTKIRYEGIKTCPICGWL